MTRSGGLISNSIGTVFRVSPDGTGYGLLHEFGDTNDPGLPNTGLLLSQGVLYGATYWGTVFSVRPDGSGYRVLTDSNFVSDIGFGPPNSLALGAGDMLYGTSDSAVFKLTPNGTNLTVLYMPDDYFPVFNGIIQGDGVLYGDPIRSRQ